jgi:hypothetical protein
MQWHLDRHLKDGSVVLFVPVVEAITAAAAAWIAVAVSVASIAYSVYMSRNMKTKTSAAETNTLTNNSFTSAENRVGRGAGATPTGRNGGRFERNFTRYRHK